MARINLHIADDLKKEMERLHWVNWSRVFAEVATQTIRKADALESEISENQPPRHKLWQKMGAA